jgi:hypothetical protein
MPTPCFSHPTRSISVLRSAALMAALFVACGRTELDDPVDVTGAAGATGGGAGAIGTGGIGTAGLSGTAGFIAGTAGFIGGTAGFLGTAGFAGTAGASGICNDGDTECVSTTDVGLCRGGQWTDAFTCPVGCVDGVCAECTPGTTQCDSMTTEQICGSNGIWSASMACAGACTNGTCATVTCTEGATTCASSQVQQTCINGAWASPVTCGYVCSVDACSENPKQVFVTSQVFSGGSLGGISGADTICQSLAQAAGLTGPGLMTKYIAWLSDSTDSPANRFPKNAGPYRLVDGTDIANSWTELSQEGIVTSGISMTELRTMPGSGTSACGPTAVWTDTKSDGALNDVLYSCDDWSNPMGTGAALGLAGLGGDVGWTDACMLTSAMTPAPCAQLAALYCFEQ